MIDLARHGDAPAIEEADGTVVTYAALLARARAYARGGVVRVPATRDTELVARCLGAWLGGGAFFPVEPCDPRPRPVIEHEPGLAYVIATSGSSGAPKHVLVGHRGIPALLAAQIDAFALGPGARALWLHAPLFDASISDWGTTLAAGATLVIPTAASLGSPARLNAELSTRAITHVDLPPSLLAHLEPPPSLRVVVLGGEPCDVQRVRSLARERRVVVVYGPTEATVCSSLVVVDPAAWERPMIGQPLPGVTYRVVDGELYIAGDALAFRYAEAAETARHFVVLDGMRWYRTGDRVDVTPQGLAYVGRVDRQCKVAGRRVELDEIEAAISRTGLVRQSAVVLHVSG
ncbi:MAG TPA: AMP-binding protein, partial [Kofleriaceae bacterium]|nr:AMP-binding protein [Kofleriaceae bacterium]